MTNVSIFPGGGPSQNGQQFQQRQALQGVGVDVTIPSATWQMLADQVRTEPLPKNLDAIWDAAKGYLGRLKFRTGHYLARARKVLSYDAYYAKMSDADLRSAALDYRALFRTGRDKPADLLKAVALVREVAARKRGEKHYFVQVAGALAMLDGCVAEMATGEGKTLTATLTATIAGWRGRGCHVITVNDYLARRDAELMRCIYEFCGLTVASLDGETEPPQRRAAYLCDITYCTNKEVCADFLRDRLSLGRLKTLPSALLGKMLYGQGTDRLVMRGLAFAIVDEADSVLIDEAVTPLIISGDAPNSEQVEAFQQAADIAARLVKGKHYKANPRYHEVELTDEGFEMVMDLSEPYGGLWNGARRAEELVNQALTAREFYLKGKQYVVAKGIPSGNKQIQEDPDKEKIVIVDEFTGRLMPDRTWREGLHQAIEAKEQIIVNPPKDTYARVSFQRFFRSYRRLCGMTGTGAEGRRELWQIYKLPVVIIPTNKKCIRKQYRDRIFSTEDSKFIAIVKEIQRLHARGQPILVGTRSVKTSERLSDMLTNLGLPHQVLNAVRHAEEAHIIAQAGAKGRITVATNMAGRGTDIKLARGVTELGGLAVIATERHESRRVDRQLFGRAARQGDPGRAQAFVCLEDELIARHAPKFGRLARLLAGHGIRPLHNPFLPTLFKRAQKKAQRMALSQRRSVLSTDDWLDESLGFAGTE
jgi:preprotein translocase subunit SecA